MQSKPNKRRGLRRLECECGASVYITWAQAEQHGLPLCGCGGVFVPDDLELAGALGVESPVMDEYTRELSSILHGQASHVQRGRTVRQPEELAAERIERARRSRALANRLGALAPAVEPMPF